MFSKAPQRHPVRASSCPSHLRDLPRCGGLLPADLQLHLAHVPEVFVALLAHRLDRERNAGVEWSGSIIGSQE